MGEQAVKILTRNKEERQKFVRLLLQDVEALSYMIENDWFETGVTRIGAEQEMCLVDPYFRPSRTAMQILDDFSPDWVTTELAQFNLEINLSPHELKDQAFRNMENELRDRLSSLEQAAAQHDTRLLLTGIIPTIRKFDLHIEKLTPRERYFALMKALKEMRGSDYELHLSGIDDLFLRHESPLLEACNTSFQVHLQVEPSNFVQLYNIAQALAGPTLAIAANSPLLFGKRLWHETRIVLFQQSIDDRTTLNYMRERSPRVTFGNSWLKDSILEIYKEDIVRFRAILGTTSDEDVIQKIKSGETPKLKALQIHNSTVYRWNRPCFGINPDGTPHLRIENRILPAGPTIKDELANTAFWIGAMLGMAKEHPDITKRMDFADAQDNFAKAARTGIDNKFTWLDNKKIAAKDLILEELLPLAREGLASKGIAQTDIDHYLGYIEERAKAHATGARWILRTYTKFCKETSRDEALTAVTAYIYKNQQASLPIHEWEIPELGSIGDYAPEQLLVEEFMTAELFTVLPDDILELVANMMEWRKMRSLLVEDDKGCLVGIVTTRQLIKHFTQSNNFTEKAATVAELMVKDPVTISPTEPVINALNLMEEHEISCLPVVSEGKLVGVITEQNFLRLTKRIMKK